MNNLDDESLLPLKHVSTEHLPVEFSIELKFKRKDHLTKMVTTLLNEPILYDMSIEHEMDDVSELYVLYINNVSWASNFNVINRAMIDVSYDLRIDDKTEI